MDSITNMQLPFMLLAALTVGAVVYSLLYPYFSGEREAEKRLQGVVDNAGRPGARKGGGQQDQANARRKAVADTLKELEDKQKAKEKVSLRLRMQRAGIDMTPRDFWIASIIAGLVIGMVSMVSMPSIPPIAVGAIVFIGIFGLPRWYLNRRTKKRQAKFLNEFANAIDVIVRGVKSGLPLNECLNIIARESPSPVREEFQDLVEQQRVGIPLVDAFDRMMSRVPLAEVKFFAIVIGIQQQAGGNLSEALGNLAGVLRDRKTLQHKVQAMSSEAKASAYVLGSLPFVVMGLVFLTAPDYIMVLFTRKSGIFLCIAAAFWMLCGVLMMKKMINFKY